MLFNDTSFNPAFRSTTKLTIHGIDTSTNETIVQANLSQQCPATNDIPPLQLMLAQKNADHHHVLGAALVLSLPRSFLRHPTFG